MSIAKQRGGVHDAFAGAVVGGGDVSAEYGSAAVRGAGGELLYDLAGAGDEGGFLEQVGRRIAANGELGKEHEVSASRARRGG